MSIILGSTCTTHISCYNNSYSNCSRLIRADFFLRPFLLMVTVQNVSKSFGEVKAVDDLSFSVKKGEIVGFLGPNGAGKTTTMRLLTGFLTPDSGTITIGDTSVMTNPILAQKQIGYLPENNPLYNDMLVSELLTLSADLKQIPPSERKTAYDFVVAAVDIADVFYRPVNELSKGYKQRLGLALALLHQPAILIMDEPSEGLDPNQRTEIRHLIKKLARNHTIILSTHVMPEAQAVCNRILIISGGRLVADGTPKELARSAHSERRLLLDVEGAGINEALKHLKEVEVVGSKKITPHRWQVTLSVKGKGELQPEISRVSHRHKWTIWRIQEEEQKLEEIFHELTS